VVANNLSQINKFFFAQFFHIEKTTQISPKYGGSDEIYIYYLSAQHWLKSNCPQIGQVRILENLRCYV